MKRKPFDLGNVVTINECTMYIKLKAALMNAVSTIYKGDFNPFTPHEIQSFLVLHILQGLSCSPQIKVKFWPQSVNKINGDDMCFCILGGTHLSILRNSRHSSQSKVHAKLFLQEFLIWTAK
jgi:hypothetical protein